MSDNWQDPEQYPVAYPIPLSSWPRILWRGLLLATMTCICLLLLLLIRLVERPIYGLRRPLTPWISQFVCHMAFVILRIGHETKGRQMKRRGAVVSNHASWLDIFSLNARKRVYFVSKAEVANWPGIGWLARATGTVFINRDPREAKAQKELFEARLMAGHKLLFFPEGTSTDSIRILPFKPTLFAAFFSEHLRDEMHVQPVTLIYHPPKGQDARFYGWWGDMTFGGHLLKVLATRRQGKVELIYHTPVKVSDFKNRKELSAYCEKVIRDGHILQAS